MGGDCVHIVSVGIFGYGSSYGICCGDAHFGAPMIFWAPVSGNGVGTLSCVMVVDEYFGSHGDITIVCFVDNNIRCDISVEVLSVDGVGSFRNICVSSWAESCPVKAECCGSVSVCEVPFGYGSVRWGW